MPIVFVKLSEAEIKEEFKKAAASDENIAPFVDSLREENIQVGDGFKLQVTDHKFVDGKQEDYVDDLSIRAQKRRWNAAAATLGFKLKWKTTGHVGKLDGTETFLPDWLVIRVDSSTPKAVNQDGTPAKKRGRKAKNGLEEAA